MQLRFSGSSLRLLLMTTVTVLLESCYPTRATLRSCAAASEAALNTSRLGQLATRGHGALHTFAVSKGRVVASAMVAAMAPDAKSSRKLFCSASACGSVMPRAGLPRRTGASAEHPCRRTLQLPAPEATLHKGRSKSAAAFLFKQRMREAVRRRGCCGTAVSLLTVMLG